MRGLSQEALGKRLGITFQQVQKYEKGVNKVCASMLWLVAKELGVAIMDLFQDLAEPLTLDRPVFSSADVKMIGLLHRLPDAQRRGIQTLVHTLAGARESEDQAAAD